MALFAFLGVGALLVAGCLFIQYLMDKGGF